MRLPRVFTALAVGAALLTTSACAPIVALDPAPDANSPACADVMVRVPDSLQGYERRETNAQATAAWGEPVSVIVRCGVEVPVASELDCWEISGTYWLRDGSDEPTVVFTSFGRDPAVDVVLDTNAATPGVVLVDLANAVSSAPENGRACTELQDTL